MGHVVGLIGGDELPEPVLRVDPGGRHREADAPDVIAAERLAHRRLDLIAPEGPKRVPLFRDVREREARALEQALPDVDVVGRQAHRQQVEATPAGRPVQQGDALQRTRIEQVRKVADSVGEVHEPTLVGPTFVRLGINYREDEVGGAPPGLDRGHKVSHQLLLRTKDELDLLAAALLERRDDLPDRGVLLGVLPLLPPHHEIGGLCAEGDHRERHSENESSNAHGVASLIKSTVDYAPARRRRQRSRRQSCRAGLERAAHDGRRK